MDVVVTTYLDVEEREQYLVDTVGSLLKNLVHDDRLRLVLADDSSSRHPRTTEKVLASATYEWGQTALYSPSEHNGIGASLNRALDLVDSLWMYTTDDWLLTKQLSLTGPTRLLTGLGYDVVRLGPVHPDLTCVTRFTTGVRWLCLCY
jgi:hypothetical protein